VHQLVRVVVATSALLGALAPAVPGGRRDGRPVPGHPQQVPDQGRATKASSTTIPPLAQTAAKHAAHGVNVDPGDSILLTSLGLPDLGLFGPDLNAHLETPSLVALGFTGVNPWTGPGRPSSPPARGATGTRT
jgi:hypothetical protein